MKSFLLLSSLLFSSLVFATPDHNWGDHATLLNPVPVADVLATANGTDLDLVSYSGQIVIMADVKKIAGTNPTMDISIQDSADNSSFAPISPAIAFTQVTTVASAQKLVVNKDALRRYLRVVMTIGGTSSPEYYVSVKVLAVKKYLP
jgi:hypothetical protein